MPLFLTAIVISAVATGACASGPLPPPFVPPGLTVSNASRPNILVLLVDDMGYSDTGAFGSPNVSTPHIDALVGSGIKLTQWISAASICTPSRASLQTGRYPIRTGCMGNVERYRVVPTPSNPGGLDPAKHMSLATALKQAGYATGMSGKWHLGINSNGVLSQPNHAFMPNAHSYDSYLGAPWTNAPMCAMDSDGISAKYAAGQTFCFMVANTTVVQQPLRLENFTAAITTHALEFLERQAAARDTTSLAAKGQRPRPWYFFMSYFHVHTPLFTNRTNRGRSRGGTFGDNVEELDDSVGAIVAALDRHGFTNDTLVFLTSDNGPYQEEGWEQSGRTNVYDPATGVLQGRLQGGKGQLLEGGVRVPGAVVWPGVVTSGTSSDTMVSTMDIFSTALAAAGVDPGPSYPVDGRDMAPVLRGDTSASQHDVFLHYCGFHIVGARVAGRFKVSWATQKWYTNDAKNASICLQCCNGINPSSKLVPGGAPATELCGCADADLTWHNATAPPVFDMSLDRFELHPLSAANWPTDGGTRAHPKAGAATGGMTYADVVSRAGKARDDMVAHVHPKPDRHQAGTCTAGLPWPSRQPCCPGCAQPVIFAHCNDHRGHHCSCDLAQQGGYL